MKEHANFSKLTLRRIVSALVLYPEIYKLTVNI